MNKIFYLVLIIVSLVVVSCGQQKKSTSEVAPSHLAILSPENILIPGPLKDVMEVVPEDDGNIYLDYSENGYPNLSLTFRLLKNVSIESFKENYGWWLVGYPQDNKGRNIDDLIPSVGEWRYLGGKTDIFLNFLQDNIGSTITLNFSGERNYGLNEEDEAKIEEGKKITAEAAKRFVKFKLAITR